MFYQAQSTVARRGALLSKAARCAGAAAEPPATVNPGHGALSAADARDRARAPAKAACAAPPGAQAPGPDHPGALEWEVYVSCCTNVWAQYTTGQVRR